MWSSVRIDTLYSLHSPGWLLPYVSRLLHCLEFRAPFTQWRDAISTKTAVLLLPKCRSPHWPRHVYVAQDNSCMNVCFHITLSSPLIYVPPVSYIKTLHSTHRMYSSVLYCYQNKQRLFPHETLSSWFFNADGVFLLCGRSESLNTIQVNF